MDATSIQTQKEKLMRAIKITLGAIALSAALAPVARSQDTADVRRLTLLTFTAPVQLPGVTLPAGTYRFEMADINNAAHTVRVLSEDGQKVHATVHTIPSTLPQRDLNDQETLMMFAERPAGMPQAARQWFYPGRSIGEEFIYPKAEAEAIAKANCTSVAAEDEGKIVRVEGCEKTAAAPSAAAPATTAARQESTAAAPAAAADNAAAANREEATTARAEAASQAPSTSSPAPAPAASASRTEAQGSVGTSGQAESQRAAQNPPAASTPAELPRTASPLGMLLSLSVLLMVAALGVHHLRKAGVNV
jgi:hypothetical protein